MKKLQEIELKIKDESEDGVFAISLVENPAIEEDFVYLSKDEVQLKVIDEDKRIVVGFALVPEKRIYRVMQGKEFNIYFSKETVRRSAELFMKKMNTQNFTLEHEQKVEGISVIESWIVEDPKQDKSNLYKLGAKGGEWVVMSKVYNDAVWQEIKDGKYGGYSIEAMYDGFEQLQSKEVNTNINKHTMEEKIIEELKTLLSSNEVKLALIDDLKKGIQEGSKQEANLYSDFKATLNGVIGKAREIEIKYNVLLSNINEPVFQMEKQAKELGLDFKTTDNYKQAQNIIKAIEGRKEAIMQIQQNIQKFGF